MHEFDPCRKLTVFKPEGTRRVGKLKLRWFGSVEEDLKKRSWRRKYQDREQWRAVLEKTKVHLGLQCQRKKGEIHTAFSTGILGTNRKLGGKKHCAGFKSKTACEATRIRGARGLFARQ
jgi:hypothetical protein